MRASLRSSHRKHGSVIESAFGWTYKLACVLPLEAAKLRPAHIWMVTNGIMAI